MITSIVDQLKRDESFRSKPYKDTTGHLTIGYGRNLDDDGIYESEAEGMLVNDVASASEQLDRALPWTAQLDAVRRGVLLNMTFNMGIRGLIQFHATLALVQKGDYEGAADEMLKSSWAEEVGPRAQRLSQQMRTGVWV